MKQTMRTKLKFLVTHYNGPQTNPENCREGTRLGKPSQSEGVGDNAADTSYLYTNVLGLHVYDLREEQR